MERAFHFERMCETSRIVQPLIQKLYVQYATGQPSIDGALDLFVKKRTLDDRCLLRPYLVRLGFEVCGGGDWAKIVPVCAAVEILNISTYQSNLAFDAKYGVLSESMKRRQFIASMISFDLAVKVILDNSQIELSMAREALNRIHRANTDVYVGQGMDFGELNVRNLDLTIPLPKYLDTYLERCRKLGGSLTSLCLEIGGMIAAPKNPYGESLREIGVNLGTAGQIVNDVGDFFPLEDSPGTQKNKYQDCYSDIKLGKVTYPVFYLLQNGTDNQRALALHILLGEECRSDKLHELTTSLLQSGAIASAKRITNGYYKRLKRLIQKLPRSPSRDFLSVSFSSLVTNKYFSRARQDAKTKSLIGLKGIKPMGRDTV